MLIPDQQAINKYLTELPVEQGGFGECWHEWEAYGHFWHVGEVFHHWKCRCGLTCGPTMFGPDPKVKYPNPDYFSDSGFVKLLRRAKESERWEEFVRLRGNVWGEAMPRFYIEDYFLDPAIFAKVWAEFCGYNK